MPALATVQDEDIVEYNSGTWSVWFDGTAAGLTSNINLIADALDIDAISIAGDATTPIAPPPPPPPAADPLYFSTVGNVNPPGVAGTADDSDVYNWNSTAYSRNFDASAAPALIPAGADVDGFDRVDNTHFYVSFEANTTLPGVGAVQDEDVVFYNNGVWSVYFDGTARGLTDPGEDLDAISIVGATLYFSTRASVNPGVFGAPDDADIYSWNGTAIARVFDASTNGIPDYANVDGVVRVDATHIYLSFSNVSTTLPGFGTVQDEDVAFKSGATWSVYFDGTLHGLGTADALDVDAFDLP